MLSCAEIEGLKRKLTSWLSPADAMLRIQWDVGECVGTSWRPNFDTISYPYLPPHVTRPKECKKMFVVPLPDRALFAVSRNRCLPVIITIPFPSLKLIIIASLNRSTGTSDSDHAITLQRRYPHFLELTRGLSTPSSSQYRCSTCMTTRGDMDRCWPRSPPCSQGEFRSHVEHTVLLTGAHGVAHGALGVLFCHLN